MVNLSDFAKARGINPQVVSIYMHRHGMPYNRAVGLTDDQLEILDEVYPNPKPVVVVNGMSVEEERALRQELENAYRKLEFAKDRVIELTEKTAAIALLEGQTAEQTKKIEEQMARIVAQEQAITDQKAVIEEQEETITEQAQEILRLRSRGFWERVFNK